VGVLLVDSKLLVARVPAEDAFVAFVGTVPPHGCRMAIQLKSAWVLRSGGHLDVEAGLRAGLDEHDVEVPRLRVALLDGHLPASAVATLSPRGEVLQFMCLFFYQDHNVDAHQYMHRIVQLAAAYGA